MKFSRLKKAETNVLIEAETNSNKVYKFTLPYMGDMINMYAQPVYDYLIQNTFVESGNIVGVDAYTSEYSGVPRADVTYQFDNWDGQQLKDVFTFNIYFGMMV